MNSDQAKTITLNVDVPGPVTSAKIEEDADIAVLDKNIYIATVSEGGKLELEMRVKNGRGYVAADRNFDEDLPIGYIPIDSVHFPVRKVNYAVEAARLGQMTDYEKLTMEVWTNAVRDARARLAEAVAGQHGEVVRGIPQADADPFQGWRGDGLRRGPGANAAGDNTRAGYRRGRCPRAIRARDRNAHWDAGVGVDLPLPLGEQIPPIPVGVPSQLLESGGRTSPRRSGRPMLRTRKSA